MKKIEKNYYHVVILLAAFLVSVGLLTIGMNSGKNIPSAFASGSCPASGANNPTLTDSCVFSAGAYSYTGTVTIAYGSTVNLPATTTIHTTGNFNIYGNFYVNTNTQLNLADGTLTVGNGTNAALVDIGTANTSAKSYIINIRAGMINIASNAVIGKRGNGYGGIQNVNGYGPGPGLRSASYSGGGAHIGAGGCGLQSGSCVTAGGSAYDNASAPTEMGSAGGGIPSLPGSNGGGYIKLQATTITNNGVVEASGNGTDYASVPGGGGGGTIYIIATNFSGSGKLYARGGWGNWIDANSRHGCGGGGIVNITSDNNSFSSSNIDVLSPSICGALGARGGAGQIFTGNIPLTVSVTSPNGTENWAGWSSHDITWTSNGSIDHYRIKLSTDSGATFPTVLTSSVASSPYNWTVNSLDTTHARIQVEAMSAANVVLATDTSNADFTITIYNLTPILNSISPTSVNGDFKGSATGFTLTVNGSGFVNSSVVRWNGSDRTTTYVSATRLTASIPSSDLTAYDTFPVTVFSPAPGGGTSDTQIFTVINPAPAATHFDPAHGSTDFTAVASLTSVPSMKLANPAGAIQWTAPVTVIDQNFDDNVKVGTGYISINKTALDPSLNAPAHISMNVITCDAYKIYYASGYRTSLDDIKTHGQICNATTTPACTNISCSGNTLTFDVPHFDGYGAEGFVTPSSKNIPTTLDISNSVPVITAGPSDGGSSVNTPTNEGSDVHFTATATDGNYDTYFLTVCRTNSITPNQYAPPSCATGQEICTSTEAASGAEASCNFGTLGFSGESQDWYAFVCDYNSDPLCSPVSQGTGDSGSPFKVNHAGTFGTVTVTNTSDGPIVPGDTLKFKLPNAQIADSDVDGTQDLLTMHICTEGTTGYDYVSHTCTGGTAICSSSPVDPTSQDAVCTGGASLVSVPTAHGDYGFKVYVEDNHNFPAVGTDSQTYTVTDVPPQIMSYSGPNAPAPSAGGSDDISFIVTIHDDNGDNDVTSVNGVFYDTAAKSLTSGLCASAEKDCYLAATCTPAGVSAPGTGKTAAGTDNELTASCTVTVWFNADYSDGWKAHVNVSDGTHDIASSADSGAVSNPALLGINVTEAGIVYGTVAIGGTSQAVETSMGNMGNQTLDVYVNGTPMTSGSYSIPAAQQKWYQTSDPFDWDASPADKGPFALTETPSGTTATGGCINRNILVRPVHDSSSTNESVYWKLRIPASQQAGSYSGQNTFSTTAGDTCTGTEF